MLKKILLFYRITKIKYFYAIFIACFSIPMSMAQPNGQNNINNFSTATWNTNGARWNIVQTFMNHGLDLLAIQEAGALNNIEDQLYSPAGGPRDICIAGQIFGNSEFWGVTESIWRVNGNDFYLYYYDRNDYTSSEPSTSQRPKKQNMAIVSRQRADEIILISPEVAGLPSDYDTRPYSRREERIPINRPALGIRINNSVFFNVHPEPTRTRNEAPQLIDIIQNYMETYHHDRTWMVMGDFNRTPTELRPDLPVASNGRFIDILHSNQNTRGSAELDYSVVGGPISYHAAIAATIAARLLQMQGSASN